LVGSTEVIRKLPSSHRLIDGYNCIAVNDVHNIEDLERRLISVLEHPDRVEKIQRNARQYGAEIELGNTFPQRLESILGDIWKAGRLSPGNIRQTRADPASVRADTKFAELVNR